MRKGGFLHGSLAKPVHRLLSPLPTRLGAEWGVKGRVSPKPPASPPASPTPSVLVATTCASLRPASCEPIALYEGPGVGGDEVKALGRGDLGAAPLSYWTTVFLQGSPREQFRGAGPEVSGQGLRRLKIALASEWKPKPCQGSFQTVFPLAGHSREPSLRVDSWRTMLPRQEPAQQSWGVRGG